VGVFAKVMLAIAILVANGVLLFVILRFLLWLAFPATKEGAEATPARSVPATPAAAVAKAGADIVPAVPGGLPPVPTVPPAPGGIPVFASPVGGRPRAYPHRLLIGLPVILALFAGGVWLGSVVGGSGAAAAATKVIRVKGTVTTVNHTTEVRVPGQTVRVKGSLVTVHPITVRLPPNITTDTIVRTHKTVIHLPGKTSTTTTTIAIPTTVTEPGTTTTVTVTSTETVTTTDTNSTSTTT
jgi:hypothetical protein